MKIHKKTKYLFYYWLIWPFGVLLWSIKNIKSDTTHTIFLLFCFYFGLTFIVPENVEGAADSARYANELMEMHSNNLTFNQFKDYLYSTETSKADIYQPLVTWLISLFTGNPKWLFAFFALVFGYFYLQNLKMIIQKIRGKYNFVLILMLILFALTNPIWNINGVRMWTAAHVFLYGLLLVYLTGRKVGFLWAASSLFIHFSFLFPVAILILYKFIPKNTWLFFFLFLGTFLVSELNIEFIRNISENLPDVFKYRVYSYTNEQVLERYYDQSAVQYSWHVIFSEKSYSYLMVLLLVFIFTQRNNIKNQSSSLILNFLNLALYFSFWTNLAALLPYGGRFIVIANSLTLIAVILYFGNNKCQNYLIRIFYLFIPFIMFNIVIKIRIGADFFGLLTLLGNPILALLVEDDIPVIEFVKTVF